MEEQWVKGEEEDCGGVGTHRNYCSKVHVTSQIKKLNKSLRWIVGDILF